MVRFQYRYQTWCFLFLNMVNQNFLFKVHSAYQPFDFHSKVFIQSFGDGDAADLESIMLSPRVSGILACIKLSLAYDDFIFILVCFRPLSPSRPLPCRQEGLCWRAGPCRQEGLYWLAGPCRQEGLCRNARKYRTYPTPSPVPTFPVRFLSSALITVPIQPPLLYLPLLLGSFPLP